MATWLNLAADHLDWHATSAAYGAAKARIWAHQSTDDVAIGNADDPVVMATLRGRARRHVTFGLRAPATTADWHGDGSCSPTGEPLVARRRAARALPHDLANALAAAATALDGGATLDGVRAGARAFEGSPTGSSWSARLPGCAGTTTPRPPRRTPPLAAVAGLRLASC